MMDKAKIVVVDDSAFMRLMISDIIGSDERLKVIAKLKNGKELLDKIDQLKPDLITLDIEMPEMDGLTTLKKLQNDNKKYPVIMLSSLTKTGSIQTMKCLEYGAVDFVEKPSGVAIGNSELKGELITKINGILENNKTKKVERKNVITNKQISSSKIDAVVIGASTGGPKALQKVLTEIDEDIGVPVFVVQHMPKGFTKAFADRLDKICKLTVVEADDGMVINKNTIYIAPGGRHMTVGENRKIKLNDEPSIWGVRPAVDKLFESAVKVYKGNLVSAVLTGMGRDGANGTVAIKENGGITISEDQSTCTIYGMPKATYETGKVDMVLPLQQIGERISAIVKGR
jgi:two-component system chemotaxis response regulator CheB